MIGRRGHEPERDAALYVSDELRRRDRERFERHLLDCDDCWGEVQAGRAGRAIAERARAVTPARLRDHVRAEIDLARGVGPE